MRLVSCLLFAAAVAIAGSALAQNPDEAPVPCGNQVKTALERIAPAYAGKTRKIRARDPGSIEAAIWGYAPPRFHDVDEGTLPPVKTRGRCPSEMALVAGRFCVDRWEGSIVL